MTAYTREEVAKHNKEDDLWIIIKNKVYDITKFGKFHPGGLNILLRFGGKECTNEFITYHNDNILLKYERFIIGDIISSQLIAAPSPFPYSEPAWYNPKHKSPYYTQSHRDFRDKIRVFVDKEIIPYCHEWDEKGTYPADLRQKAYDAGIYASQWPVEYGGTPPEKNDAFHDLILIDELSRCGCGGLLWSLFFSFSISLPPILEVGSQYLKDLVARDVITGKKVMSLAVTEPSAGSDVAGLHTTAVLTKNDKGQDVYIVNGEKRYITGGVQCDYLTVAVRIPGTKGISLLLLDKTTMKGITTRRQKTTGWLASNTAFIHMKDVEVPICNLIGKPGEGWMAVMHNFNHERFVFAAMSIRYSRVMLSDAVTFARARDVFKTALSQHQVIRHKIAHMCEQIELGQTYLETIAYQMTYGRLNELSGQIAMAKVHSTKTMELCARESQQILGGCSYIRGGAGDRIERLAREVRVNAVAGGSEEILVDLFMRQAKL